MLEVNQFVNQMVVNGRSISGDEVLTRNLANDHTEVRGFGKPVTKEAAKQMVEDYYEEIRSAFAFFKIIEEDERYTALKEDDKYKALKKFLDPEVQTVSGVFGKEIIMQILSQRNCEGIRYVVGKDSLNKLNTVVLLGVEQVTEETHAGQDGNDTALSKPLDGSNGSMARTEGSEAINGEVHEHSLTLAEYENKHGQFGITLSDVLFGTY
ncbi:MAG TPA: hypothetical protein VJ720_07005 [Chitinophaga sp.]|nr:hypothetical protein [Chitinophaga sp.]